MRNRLHGQYSRVRTLRNALGALLLTLSLSGCGGGGGGSSSTPNPNPNPNPNPGSTTLATVTGKVIDNISGNGVGGASVTILGTSLAATTANDGTFTLTNVPLTAKQFLVNTPNINSYFNYVQYQGNGYDTDPARVGGQCKLPLPTLNAGQDPLPASIIISRNGTTGQPPPPPLSGCPGG